MFVRRAARTVRGFLKRGSERRRTTREALLDAATACVIESIESRLLLSATNDTGHAILSLSDGRTLVAGVSEPYAAFAMYTAEGALDPTFDGDGKARRTEFEGRIFAMAEAAAGKIVAVGSRSVPTDTGATTQQLLVMQLNADGTLDTGFGINGLANFAFGSGFQPSKSAATGVAIKDGDIVVAGHATFGSEDDFVVARFDSGGSADATFGHLQSTNVGVGIVRADAGRDDSGGGIAIASGGDIFMVGSSADAAAGFQFSVVRFLNDGGLHPTFGGGDGVVQKKFGFLGGSDIGTSIALVNGSVLVAGTADAGSSDARIALARFTDSGAPDTTFGRQSLGTRTGDVAEYLEPSGSFEMHVGGMAIDSGGRILVAGVRTLRLDLMDWDNPVHPDVAVVRYDAAGARDFSFGDDDGVALGDAGGEQDQANALTVLGDGTVLVAGRGHTAGFNSDFALLEFSGSGEFGTVRHAEFFTQNLSVSVQRATGGEGQDVTLSSAVSGATGAITYQWDISPGATVVGDSTSSTLRFVAADDGTYTVTLTATDANGLVGVNTRFITISNLAPTLTDLGPDVMAEAGADVSFSVTPADVPADAVTVSWAVTNSSGDLVGSGTGNQFSFTAGTAGPYVVTVLATDGEGGVTSDSVIVTVDETGGGTVNQPPVAQPGGPYSVSEGGSVGLNGGGSTDADGSIVTYEWDFDYDGNTFDIDATGATPNFSATGIDGPASRVVALRVTDDLGASHLQTVLVNVTNAVPVASIGGNLAAVEGSPVSLTGTFTDVGESGPHTTVWQVVASNGQVIPNGSGASFGFTPIDDGTYTVTFTVTDDDGGVGTASVVVTVTNAVPVVTLVRNDTDPVVRQWEVKLTGSFTDAGSADTHVLTWQVVDPAGAVTTGTGANVRFTPVSSGQHVVTFTVTDDHGSGTASATVTAVDAEIVQGVLRVGGTSLADDIDIEPTSIGTVRVRFAGVSTGTFAPTGGVIVRAGSRADDVTVVTGLSRQTSVYGGSGPDTLRSGNAGDMLFGDGGNDSILGNSGNDVLVGGDGNDLLVGGKGDDLLIGGLGADSIVGNANDDVIIGGWTLHDGSPDDLRAVHRIWLRRLDYATGVAALRVPGALLEDETVFDDGARDVMTGEGGKDVFYGNFTKPLGVLDVITDLKAIEFAADLDLILPLES